MSLQQQIKDDLKGAMKAKETTKVSVLRNVTSEITNELLKSDKTPQDELDDEGVQRAIERLAKQRRESIQQYEDAGRTEAAQEEKDELSVLESYLPEKMSKVEIRSIVESKAQELGVSDVSETGTLMKEVMPELKGKADGAVVKDVVSEVLGA